MTGISLSAAARRAALAAQRLGEPQPWGQQPGQDGDRAYDGGPDAGGLAGRPDSMEPDAARLIPLVPDAGPRQAQLFCLNLQDGALILKVWSPGAAARAVVQVRRQSEVAEALGHGAFRAPKVRFFDEAGLTLAMPRIEGRDLAALWRQTGDSALARRAGAWLAAFHGLTREPFAFRPAGQVNWLNRLIEAGAQGRRQIPEFDAFCRTAQAVQDSAGGLRGRPAFRAVTHRDMTLSNLMLDGDGVTWGLDFENARQDECLRDVFTLGLDLLTLGPLQPDMHTALADLRAGYGDTETDPGVRLFLQRCFCLWVWANTPPAPSARQLARFEVAERLLAQDCACI